MFSLKGKHAFITGAAGGIGLAVAKRFRQAGARVTCADIGDGAAKAAAIGADFQRMDVGDETCVRDGLIDSGTSKPIDILVLNAGIGDIGDEIANTSFDLLGRITRINYWGVLYGLKHGPPQMNDGGSIIITSSLAAVVNMPGSAAYSAAKRAILSLTEMAALELGDRGIRVNAICPSYVATALGSGDEGVTLAETFTPLGRLATTDDLVGVYHFLASDESSYISGQSINVDGGWTCGPSKRLLGKVIGSDTVS